MKFTEMGLSPETLQSIQALGFETPTPIQEQAIPILLEGKRDFVGLASTGTGKTAAFGLPLLERIDADLAVPQGVILCPTRELCLQIAEDLKKYSKHRAALRVVAVYGGSPITTQIRDLKRGAQIIVATPGRLMDLIERRAVKVDQISMVVLDEADEMLNMGFKEELDKILGKMPEERVTWLFSATMAKGVAHIAQNYQTDPVEVSVGGRNESAANIQHLCFMVHEKDRYPAVKRILDFLPEIYGLIFCRTRAETQTVAEKLIQDGYMADSLHGDLSQAQRDAVMRKFRQKNITILVATDVAARGIDVDDITHVIHYKLSDEIAAYTHRSGRTARAGKSGVSIALVNMHERRRIVELERRNNIKIALEKVPDAKAICENQLLALIHRVVECKVNEEEIKDYLPPVYEALCHLDKKEIIKRFVAIEFNHFLEYYRNADDINVKPRPQRERQAGQQRSDNSKRNRRMEAYDTKRFSINVGRVHKVNAGAIVRLVCENCGVKSNQIGAIDLGRDSSFFEVSKEASAAIQQGLSNLQLDGRQVSIRSASGQGGGQGGGRQGGRPGGGRQGHPGGRKPRRD
ncbi:DEAD/DEAH box helicase [Pontiella sulfatireligans]|uniref:ATP-dependent RNA helicase CshA n=1 Tax=Pontiella sulfatireligans TaxID=2750658 RepID=A0A6C2UL64_9BACT|nr:DEAD/DEAH box helicase [Pontiella sulfatireligans]VGO20633.1 ATP-dependent RNA helicase CshA [Pontiella sulfatireligans]